MATTWATSNPSTRCTSARSQPVTAADGTSFKVTKGAPQVIIELSANADEVRSAVDGAVDGFAKRGYRLVGRGPGRRERPLAVPTVRLLHRTCGQSGTATRWSIKAMREAP